MVFTRTVMLMGRSYKYDAVRDRIVKGNFKLSLKCSNRTIKRGIGRKREKKRRHKHDFYARGEGW